MIQRALVTGVTGMDGSWLVDQLLDLNYDVYGIVRRTSNGGLGNCSHVVNPKFKIIEADITDLPSMIRACTLAKADKFFHMAAQSHVGISFQEPVLTYQTNAIGTLNCLEAIRLSGYHTRFLHAATSELYGGVYDYPVNETTPFYPKSPYGVSKLAAYWQVINYRESYRMFACNSICFNHEGTRRSKQFVTRKITNGIAQIKLGKLDKIKLGNLDAKRDWGNAQDYTQGMIKILSAASPDDYVLSTGETHSVREFCEIAFDYAGLGNCMNYIDIDPILYRPTEVDILIGDSSKIHNVLGWQPTTSFKELVQLMVEHDLNANGIK